MYDDFPNVASHVAVIYTRSPWQLSADVRHLGGHLEYTYSATSLPRIVRYPSSTFFDLGVSHTLSKNTSFIAYVHNVMNIERYDQTNLEYARGRRIGTGIRFGNP